MDVFTCSEKAMSIVVVVARPDPAVAVGYMVPCEIVYVVNVGESAACTKVGKARKVNASSQAVRMGIIIYRP